MVNRLSQWPLLLLPLVAALGCTAPARAQCLLCEAEADSAASTAADKAALDSAAAKARPNLPLRISIQTKLDFSRAAFISKGSGTITLTPNGQKQVSGALENLGGMAFAGTVDITGTPLRAVRVDIPSEVKLNAPGGSKARIVNIRTNLNAAPRLDLFGTLRFSFGGDFVVESGEAGEFRGRVPISVDYE